MCLYPRPRVLSTIKQSGLMLLVHVIGIKPLHLVLLCLAGRYLQRVVVIELLTKRALAYQESMERQEKGEAVRCC